MVRRTQRRRRALRRTRRQRGGDFEAYKEKFYVFLKAYGKYFREDGAEKRMAFISLVNFLMQNDMDFTKSQYMPKYLKTTIYDHLRNPEVDNLPDETVRDMETLKTYFGV